MVKSSGMTTPSAPSLRFGAATPPFQGRKTVALEKSFAPVGAWFCPNGNHGLQPWLYSDAAPRLLSAHPEFLEIRTSEIADAVWIQHLGVRALRIAVDVRDNGNAHRESEFDADRLFRTGFSAS
ncbi:MAG: hypothetical protein DMG05_30300 [Acidobacteria bacterium]|nr:MAG: hypothetical protein DMG05_30300 [Acidobacteriota bacterium]